MLAYLIGNLILHPIPTTTIVAIGVAAFFAWCMAAFGFFYWIRSWMKMIFMHVCGIRTTLGCPEETLFERAAHVARGG